MTGRVARLGYRSSSLADCLTSSQADSLTEPHRQLSCFVEWQPQAVTQLAVVSLSLVFAVAACLLRRQKKHSGEAAE